MENELSTETPTGVETENQGDVSKDINLSNENEEPTLEVTEEATESEAKTGEPDSNELSARYKASSEEALRQKKRADEAEALLQKQKDIDYVREDKGNIFELAKDDYAKAQSLAQEIYGKSLDQIESEALTTDSLSDEEKNQIRIAKSVRAALEQERAKGELTEVRELEENYFSSKGLLPGSQNHAIAMNSYRQLTEGQNKTLSFVKKSLNIVANLYAPKTKSTGNIENASISISEEASTNKPKSNVEKWETMFERETPFTKRLNKK